jgi:DNA polymerase III alpha subunit
MGRAQTQAVVALTDTNNMFGALEFSDKLAGAGIQPIIGYRNLLHLSSRAFLEISGL